MLGSVRAAETIHQCVLPRGSQSGKAGAEAREAHTHFQSEAVYHKGEKRIELGLSVRQEGRVRVWLWQEPREELGFELYV